MAAKARAKLKRALELLKDEIKTQEDIFDLLDRLEPVASCLAEYALPTKLAKRGYSLDRVLKYISKGKGELKIRDRMAAKLKKTARWIRDEIKACRKNNYNADNDDDEDLLATANGLRESVVTAVKEVMETENGDEQNETA